MTLLGGIFSSSSFSFQRESAGLLKFEFLDIWKNLISFSHFNDIMAEHRNLDLNFFSFTKLKISSNVFFHPTLLMTHLMPNLIRITSNSLLLNLSGGCSSLSLSLQLLAYWLYWLMKVLNFDYFCTLPFIFCCVFILLCSWWTISIWGFIRFFNYKKFHPIISSDFTSLLFSLFSIG